MPGRFPLQRTGSVAFGYRDSANQFKQKIYTGARYRQVISESYSLKYGIHIFGRES